MIATIREFVYWRARGRRMLGLRGARAVAWAAAVMVERAIAGMPRSTGKERS